MPKPKDIAFVAPETRDQILKALEKRTEYEPTTTERFKIEVSDFTFVTRGIKNGKALRFSVTWMFEHPQYGLLGKSEEGWLATKNQAGYLKVSPPISRFGPMQSKQLGQITVGFHDLIRAMIINHKTKSGISYSDYIGGQLLDELRAKAPHEIDEELPEELRA